MINTYIIGIDEAGRGPLAGPVAVGFFCLKDNYKIKKFPKGRDSKKMSEIEREYWYDIFKKEKGLGSLYFTVNYSSSKEIDKKGISLCIKECIRKGILKINRKWKLSDDTKIFLDGSLRAPANFNKQKTIIKGDEKISVIACASIVAKVERDRLMKSLAKEYPAYGFDKHKGYGTKMHRFSISKIGLSPLHRSTYCKKI